MALNYFYVDPAGADTNSGSSSDASPKANGTAATRATNVYTLDGSPDLSGVSATLPNADTIRIVGETSGLGEDGETFLITAVDDGADTVTVTPTPTGGTSGLTWAIGGAVATVQKGASTADNGDWWYIKGGTYNETVTNTGTLGTTSNENGVTFEGYTTTPGDDGQVTVSATSTHAWKTPNVYHALEFRNIIFDGGSGYAADMPGNDTTFMNCVFQNATTHGLNGGDFLKLVGCKFLNNGQRGADIDADCMIHACEFGGNGEEHLYAVGVTCTSSVMYGSTTEPNYCISNGFSSTPCRLIGNTCDGEGTQNYAIQTSNPHSLIVDNIFTDFLVAGTSTSNNSQRGHSVIDFNMAINCNQNRYALSHYNIHGITSTTSPFTDQAGDDYTLAADSEPIGEAVQIGSAT